MVYNMNYERLWSHQKVDEQDAHDNDEYDPEDVGDHRKWNIIKVSTPFIVQPKQGAVWTTRHVHHNTYNGHPRILKWRRLNK